MWSNLVLYGYMRFGQSEGNFLVHFSFSFGAESLETEEQFAAYFIAADFIQSNFHFVEMKFIVQCSICALEQNQFYQNERARSCCVSQYFMEFFLISPMKFNVFAPLGISDVGTHICHVFDTIFITRNVLLNSTFDSLIFCPSSAKSPNFKISETRKYFLFEHWTLSSHWTKFSKKYKSNFGNRIAEIIIISAEKKWEQIKKRKLPKR